LIFSIFEEMGMYHSTSGKRGFDAFFQHTDLKIDKEVLKTVLIREDQLRASEEMQQKYSMFDQLAWIRDVTREIQKIALQENGIDDPRGMIVLNNARFEYKDDPEMNNLTIYMREDKSTRGNLRVGDKVPDAFLRRLDGTEISLLEYLNNRNSTRPTVLLAGSVT